MKSIKFNVIRLAGNSKAFAQGADIEVLRNWHATTLHTALRLCELAAQKFGGQWVPAVNGAQVVTVWVGFKASDVAPAIPMRRKMPRKVSGKVAA